ncbi:unnamed protein product [Porites lobata]|uniref:Uncharacterized protein n=1 Tax=Porites lobata TaxID=104759 RepID=A0ABN8MUL0_9CNID|nr:unnamed protein product [Porites lobata]
MADTASPLANISSCSKTHSWPQIRCVHAKRSHQRKGSCCKTLYSLFTPFRKKWKKSSPIINVRYLYQPGELEGGRQRATDAVWSLKVHNFLPPLVKPNEPIVYYLQDGPKRGFVLEELLAILPNTTLPFVSDTQ